MDTSNKIGGNWQMLKILGSGGFGQVTLWYNPSTNQKIAVKKLLESTLKDPTMKAKVTERWCNEVEIMKKLNHVNVVTTLKIPCELDISEGLPVLGMEYCSNGDLRQVLNKGENCCGLPEPEILNILRDISNGLAYLHSCKVIHRDIKPDNIVMQEKGSGIIYKLIDLGYAKAFDQSSLSESFVGTVQYIAPELFMGKAYTSSVDYWSFGLMTHEIITGYRPFLPGCIPSDWMKQIQNKARSVISVLENNNGDIVFSSKISQRNHSSRCFLEDIEKWLQLALDWDGQTRGRDTENNRLVIFENLTEIICKTLINVFSLPTYETLSFEVKIETDISDLRRWLKENTGLDEGDQLLLLPNGKCLNVNGNLLKMLQIEKMNRSDVSLFLYNSGHIGIRPHSIKTPAFVNELKESLSNRLPYKRLKRYCADLVYFLQSQATFYRNLLQGIKVKIMNTKQKTLAVESLYEDVVNEWKRTENYCYFLLSSHKIDLENYIYYRKSGKLESSSFVRKWIQNAINVNNKVTELKNFFNVTKQRQLVLLAKQRCRNLDDHSVNDCSVRTPLDGLVIKGQEMWDNLQKLSKNERNILMSDSNIIQLMNETIDETTKFLNSQMLKTLFMKIWEADENLARFLRQLKNLHKSTNILKRVIESTQAERQKEVWSLIVKEKLCRGDFSENVESIENGDSKVLKCAVDKNETDKFGIGSSKTFAWDNFNSFVAKESKVNGINGSPLSFKPDFVDTFSLLNSSEICSIVENNNHLRYRLQEIQQNSNQILKEVVSLNWDSLLEP